MVITQAHVISANNIIIIIIIIIIINCFAEAPRSHGAEHNQRHVVFSIPWKVTFHHAQQRNANTPCLVPLPWNCQYHLFFFSFRGFSTSSSCSLSPFLTLGWLYKMGPGNNCLLHCLATPPPLQSVCPSIALRLSSLGGPNATCSEPF